MKIKNLIFLSCMFIVSSLQSQVQFILGNSGSSSGWYKLGRLSLDQQGRDAIIRISGGNGYNSSINQNGEAVIHFRTSNNGSNDNGFYGAGSFYNTGRTKILNSVRIVQIDGVTWDFYAFLPSFTGDGANLVVESVMGSWTRDFYIVNNPPATDVYNDLTEEIVYQSPASFTHKIGVGTFNPVSEFQVSGDNSSQMTLGSSAGILFSVVKNDEGYGMYTGVAGSGDSWIQAGRTSSATAYNLDLQASGGNVGIGTTSPTEKLSVNGNIRSKKLIVTQNGWSDYVFDSSYQLESLTELEQFIKTNKHLPDVPSAKEVAKDGIDVGDNQTLLLKKIEELTLYIIEMKKNQEQLEKKNDEQQKEIGQMKMGNSLLKQRIEKLENKK